MKEHVRNEFMAKMEEIEHRCGALAAAAKLLEEELRKMQTTFWRQTAQEE